MHTFVSELMKKTPYFLLVLLLVLGMCACSSKDTRDSVILSGVAFNSMTWTVKINGSISIQEQKKLRKNLQKIIDDSNMVLSTYQKNSELMKFNRAPVNQSVVISPLLKNTLKTALKVSAESNGYYDITIFPLVNLWGFGPAKQSKKEPTAQQIKSIKETIGWQYLELGNDNNQAKKLKEIQVDLSSIGEGVAVDELTKYLLAQHYQNFMVSVAGCTRTVGNRTDGGRWLIAIENPTAKTGIETVVNLSNAAVSTSGSYRNYRDVDGVHLSHTINPITGYPIKHRGISVSVAAAQEDAAAVDAWATALNVLGPNEGFELAQEKGIAAYFVEKTDQGYKTYQTDSWLLFSTDKPATKGFLKKLIPDAVKK
jgi:thiamine biosynthesis lipoprotein